jgi:hypothetical protein
MADSKLHDAAVERFKLFQDEILKSHKDNIHSITITGSSLTDDFDPEKSDVNSVLVLDKMDLGFLEVLASLGKAHGKKGISAPLIMTPEYIVRSLDVFPVEFLNIKLLHETLFGEDLFQNLEIDRKDLRMQCERELKVRLIGLRQGYISAMGHVKLLSDLFINTISGYIPLFRGIILIFGKEPPLRNEEVLQVLETVSGVNAQVFGTILKQKRQKTKLAITHLNAIFKDCYAAVEKLGDITDGIED